MSVHGGFLSINDEALTSFASSSLVKASLSPSIEDCFFCHSIPPGSNPFVASLIALFVAKINLSWKVKGVGFEELVVERVERETEFK